MTVFKKALKIMYKEKFQILLYTGILIGVCIINQTFNTTQDSTYYDVKPDIMIVNNDEDSTITEGFINYLDKYTNIKDIDSSTEEKINDAVFYREVNYVVYIENDFSEKIENGIIPEINIKQTGDANSSYTELLVEKYIKVASLYTKYFTGNELNDKVENVLDNDINIELKTKVNQTTASLTSSYFSFLNYAFIAACVYVICMVLASIKENNIQKRNNISSFKSSKLNKELLYANGLFVFIMWIIYMIIGLIFFKDNLLNMNGIMYGLNSLVFIFNCLTLGLLIGNITNNKNAIGGILNVLGLGTSFLCGCFVPTEYLPEMVVNFSKILPSYWYVNSNNLISQTDVFNTNFYSEFLINIGVIIGFSILFIILTNIISKKKLSK